MELAGVESFRRRAFQQSAAVELRTTGPSPDFAQSGNNIFRLRQRCCGRCSCSNGYVVAADADVVVVGVGFSIGGDPLARAANTPEPGKTQEGVEPEQRRKR